MHIRCHQASIYNLYLNSANQSLYMEKYACHAQNEPTKRMLATETKFITGMRKGKHVKIDNNYRHATLHNS